jgi:formylglycine-generating enzyme required for sulfatase activity
MLNLLKKIETKLHKIKEREIDFPPFPLLHKDTFKVGTIIFIDDSINTQIFNFKVAVLKANRSSKSNSNSTLENVDEAVDRYSVKATGFIQDLGNEIELEMMLIPVGTFIMGSPPEELERQDDESPQHRVTVQPLFMGKYQVTQVEWQAVTSFPKINIDLDPDPSRFKGANRPVENVSWNDTVEFCDRFSKHTKRHYRLPSEAEWEYACKAGTNTPFHFGETITTDFANYNGDKTYGDGVKGIYRGETTEVGSFGVANNFGLYDMHGNVWEWCQDTWHDRYEDAPTDGSAWIDKNDNQYRVLRGGSWLNDPEDCRSANRLRYTLDSWVSDTGFRVVLGGVARTLL